MNIGIIGAGLIGATLAGKFNMLGHGVKIANSRGPDTLVEVAERTGATAVTLTDAVQGVDLIVITIPFAKIAKLPKTLFSDVPVDTVVVETGNYSPVIRDERIDAIEAGLTESQWVSEQIGRPVIKAFNTLRANHLETRGRAEGDPERIAMPVAGDDADAKVIVMELVNAIGFDAIDGGKVDESWRQQLGMPVAGIFLDSTSMIEGLARADRTQVSSNRDKIVELYQSGAIQGH